MRLKNWVEHKLASQTTSPLFRLFLLGLRGQINHNTPKPYSFYPRLISAILSVAFAKWLVDLKQCELDKRGHNWLVPEYVYRVREESYIYWQLARLANKLPTTFTYYKWDDNLMYSVNRKGQQAPFHSHAGIESPETFGSFLHEYNFPAPPERHARIMMYLRNIKDPYDLHNYLRGKSINMGDWVRAGYYMVYRELGLTNRWRYDEFVAKPAVYYGWEKMKMGFLLSRDREGMYKALEEWEGGWEELLSMFCWIL